MVYEVKDKKSCKVLLVQTTSSKAEILDAAIKKVTLLHLFRYLSWSYWQPLQLAKKETLIKAQCDYMAKYASVYLSNFIDENKTKLGVPEVQETIPYSNMMLNNFIQTLIHVLGNRSYCK
jgi:hypothetical protein